MKLRIIVFQDDTDIRELLVEALQDLGHEVLAFRDPLACPLYWRDDCRCGQEAPCGDLLICDNRLPRLTGLEFIRRQVERGCRGVAANKALLSGAWTDAQRAEARRFGCQVFAKPLALELLLNWVAERGQTIPPERQLAQLAPSPP